MKSKILIALKDYALPNNIVNYGSNLAKRLDVPATLIGVERIPVHSEPLSITGSGIAQPAMTNLGRVKDNAEIHLNKLALEAKKIHPDTDFNVKIGFWESQLVNLSDEENPFLMVIEGNNELTTMNEWFGTYETRLAEGTSCPVLVVPSDYEYQSVRNILYIMDLEDETVENMRTLSRISKKLHAHVTVAVVSENVKEQDAKFVAMTKTFRQLLGYDSVTYRQIYTEQAAETIEEIMKETQSDWLAFEQQNKGFFERLFDDYNTQKLILKSEVPVLVF